MTTTARLDLSVWRNDDVYELPLRIIGPDLTGVAMRAQLRLAPDTPGSALAALVTVTNGNAEGVRLAGVTSAAGVYTNDVRIRLNKSTRQALPYSGELGDAAVIAWAFQIAGRTRIVGDVRVLAHTIDSDAAPTNRPAGFGARSAAMPSGGATMTIAGDEVVSLVIDGADIALAAQAGAQSAQAAAELASATALASGRYFTTRALGETGSSTGQMFSTDDGAGALIFYKKTSGSSTEIGRAVTPASLAAADGSTRVGQKATGTGAAIRTAAQVMDEVVYASGFTGYEADGEAITTSDSYAAIMAADVVARARNKDLVLHGRPRIKTPIVIDAPTRWRMQGQHFKPGFLDGGSAIVKDPSLASSTATAIRITKNAWQTTLESVGLIGLGGNGGDGIHIEGNVCQLVDCSVQGMGQDGLRIGAKSPDTGINADCFRILNFHTAHNGRDGINIDDLSGVTNANAGLIDRPVLLSNGRHGIYINNAYLGNTILTPLCESNVGRGIYLDAAAQNNIIQGGDIEANDGGNVYEAVPGANQFIEVVVQGVVWNTLLRGGSFVPTIYGASSAGSASYSLQKGRYTLSGNRVDVDLLLTWSGHTGTGSMRFSLPAGFLPNSTLAAIPDFTVCAVLPNGAGLTVPAGAALTGLIIATGQYGAVYSTSAGGAGLTPMPMSGAGSLIIKGSYERNPPVARL